MTTQIEKNPPPTNMGHIFVETYTPDASLDLKLSNLNQSVVGLGDVYIYFQSVHPLPPNVGYYLCCDLIKESPLQINVEDIRYFPVLRRLQFQNAGTDQRGGQILNNPLILDKNFDPVYKFPVRRVDVEGFRLYLIDVEGNIPSLANFQLKCTLVYQSA